MKHIGLFEGIGGFSLAARWMGWQTVAWCEWIESKQQFLKQQFPNATGHGNIETTDFTIYRGKCDILTGGFPCQDASIAKQNGDGQQGLQGSRTGLVYHMLRAIKEIGPTFIVAENVSNLLKTNEGADFSTILGELAGLGYNAEWRVCRASEVGAPHQRARMYLVAYPDSIRLQKGQTFFSLLSEKTESVGWKPTGATIQISRGGSWTVEPPILCVDDGVSGKLVREQLHGYGNAIVPQVAFQIFKAIDELNELCAK
jgi:DNA (cytosine-5)-methyltransferase 1